MADMLTRRMFVAGGVAAGTMAAASTIAKAEEGPAWMPRAWDDEADVVVVGCGAAGLCAATQALEDGVDDVLVLEAAPEEYAGGSTRVSGGLIMMPNTAEGAYTYQSELNGPYVVDEDIMRAWAEGVVGNKAWLDEHGISVAPAGFSSPEYPGVPGGEEIVTYYVEGGVGGNDLWQPLFTNAQAAGARFSYDTRATELVFEPVTHEVYGVRAEDGRTFKARRGVVLACGGFTNNQDMISDYYCGAGASKVFVIGSPYDRGDGVRMAQQIGACLWHMNNYSGNGAAVAGSNDWTNTATSFSSSQKDWIYVGPDGKRFMNEEENGLNRHGRMKSAGAWPVLSVPTTSWMVFGSDCFEAEEMSFNKINYMVWTGFMGTLTAKSNQEMVDQGIILAAETLEELAEKTGLPAAQLAKTVENYNAHAQANEDPDFGRGKALYSNYFYNPDAASTGSAEDPDEQIIAVESFDLQQINPPYYAVEIRAAFMNTQGGAKRDGSSRVLDLADEPISRLFSAGEFGAPYPYMYNGGGNISDAIYSGRTAGSSVAALEPWE